MPLENPDILEHANKNNAALDTDFVRGAPRVVANLTELYALASKADQLKNHATIVTVLDDGNGKKQRYELVNKADITNGVFNPTAWLLYTVGADENKFLVKTGTTQQNVAPITNFQNSVFGRRFYVNNPHTNSTQNSVLVELGYTDTFPEVWGTLTLYRHNRNTNTFYSVKILPPSNPTKNYQYQYPADDGTFALTKQIPDVTVKEDKTNKNQPNGYAGLDSAGKVAAEQLPSYVDDIVEVATQSALPQPGETGKIYIALDTGAEYRWGGSTYAEIIASPGSTDEITEGNNNKFFTVARTIGSVLTGYVKALTKETITAGKSILEAFGILEKRLEDVENGLSELQDTVSAQAFTPIPANTNGGHPKVDINTEHEYRMYVLQYLGTGGTTEPDPSDPVTYMQAGYVDQGYVQ
ncbi:hypothetical protein [Pedobacter sp. SYSU D00535]|uniref:hypothetical protein n=1 Tax=Pedobacter sp. SYSU D00535 TaxID=2810308 RepID=UPI001A966B0D|nr:hypothetical protein [Pedobacter sp. SYSU D00535]